MELWQDQGVVLSVRAHGENGGVLSLLTEMRGRHAGYVRGTHSSKMRGSLEVGNLVDVRWQSRVENELGTFTIELKRGAAARVMDDPLKLAALQSACALCDAGLPEREGHPGLFYGLMALIDVLESDVWAQAYVMWEVAFLKELGFSLDLTKCAGGGDAADLAYVSPKTGRAVSRAAGAIYKERLLALPGFLRPTPPLTPPHAGGMTPDLIRGEGGSGTSESEDILAGLKMTGYFLEHWAFAHHSQGMPEARLRFYKRMENYVTQVEARRLSPGGV